MNTLDPERALIAELVYDHTQVRAAAAHVTPQDFSNLRLGNTFGLIAALASSGRVVDGTVLLSEVQQRAKTERTEWPDPRDLVALVGAGSGVAGAAVEYARQIAERALRRSVSMASRQTAQDAEESNDPASLVTEAIRRLELVRERHATGEPGAGQSLRELLDNVPEDEEQYDWVVPGLLERGDRLILTGDEGAGKSTWLRQLALLPAAGLHPLTLAPIDPVRVLVVDAENSERQWRRQVRGLALQAARNGLRDPAVHTHVVCTLNDTSLGNRQGILDLTRTHDLEAVHRLMEEHAPDILLIGPLYKLAPRALQTDDEAAPVLAALDALRGHGATLLLEAHFGNAGSGSNGPRDPRPRGSRAQVGWPEFGLCLAKATDVQDDGSAVDVIRWRGDREARPWPERMWRTGPYPWIPDGTPLDTIRRHREGRAGTGRQLGIVQTEIGESA